MKKQVFTTTRLLIVTAAAISGAGCGATDQPASQPVAQEDAAEQTATPEPPPYEVAFVYSKDSHQWQAIVVDRDVDLATLARHLHAKLPTVRFQIFDNEEGVETYVNWTKNYPSDQYPYPEDWVKQHHLAMINVMASRDGPRWELQGGTSHPTHPNQQILTLD